MRAFRHLVVAIGISLFAFGGCGKQPAPSSKSSPQTEPSKPLLAPPELTSETEEGFHDLVFYLQEYKRLPDGSQWMPRLRFRSMSHRDWRGTTEARC
jgi:hypothetical protein